jgi:hypothetical protein
MDDRELLENFGIVVAVILASLGVMAACVRYSMHLDRPRRRRLRTRRSVVK